MRALRLAVLRSDPLPIQHETATAATEGMNRTQRFIVTVPIVVGVKRAQMASYIEDAIRGWSGGGDPMDPLFGAFREDDAITVRPMRGDRK